jgi:hypothetical protein
LPKDELDRIERAVRDRFGDVTRGQVTSLEVFTAVRSR